MPNSPEWIIFQERLKIIENSAAQVRAARLEIQKAVDEMTRRNEGLHTECSPGESWYLRISGLVNTLNKWVAHANKTAEALNNELKYL